LAATAAPSPGFKGEYFSANLSSGYSAMMQVFKYLNARDKMKAAKVCKLWRDLAMNPDLWTSISLKVS
jgi:hypothetical protein